MRYPTFFLAMMLLAASSRADSVQGQITLPRSVLDTNVTVQTAQVGEAVKAKWSCRVGEFYGWDTIYAQVAMTNTASQPMWGQCSIAFYDANKNLVGAATQVFLTRHGFRPRQHKLGLWRILLPRDKYRDITSYQVVINEIDSPPSKQKEPILLEDP